MTDIPLILSNDGTSMDWCDPVVLAQPVDSSLDVETYVLMLLGTDRVAPAQHYGIQPYQRRGCWQDSFVGEFGALFWLGTEMNIWYSTGSKLAQVQAYAQQALQPVYNEGLILQPATINAEWVSDDAIQLQINLIKNNGQTRAITYVLGT